MNKRKLSLGQKGSNTCSSFFFFFKSLSFQGQMYVIGSLKYYFQACQHQNLQRLNLPTCGNTTYYLPESHCSGMPVGPFPTPGINHNQCKSITGTSFLIASCWFRAEHDSFLANEICGQGYRGPLGKIFLPNIKKQNPPLFLSLNCVCMCVCVRWWWGGWMKLWIGTVFLGIPATITYP